MATRFVRLRAGTDVAFLGGIIHNILEHGREFREYVVNYTNAPVIVDEGYRTPRISTVSSRAGIAIAAPMTPRRGGMRGWMCTPRPASARWGANQGEGAGHGGHGAGLSHGEPPEEDMTLEHPRCVYQILKRHYARYTPELVERGLRRPAASSSCRWPRRYAATRAASGRRRIVYSVGWTQHTIGVQYIRAAAIIQLLLGNIGRPGGGIMALRGHASIQGSTDIPTLYNILPGYIPMPHAHAHDNLSKFVELNTSPSGFWGNMGAYTVSLLKAWWGPRATPENDFCFDYLPRITGDHSIYPTVLGMLDGSVKGFIVVGQNPAVGSANSGLHRRAMANLDWLVVRDFVETESAAFWYDSPEVESGELDPDRIGTEVFFLPAAAHTEKDGSFTNTQRLLQWHHKAVEPRGDCRSELWFYYHLGRLIREKLADSEEERDRPVKELAWHYPTAGEIADPSAEAVLREINGWDGNGEALSSYLELKDDGSTACGCWIYAGCYADETNQPARRRPGGEQSWVAPEWGWAWPANRRILYNRASADPEGRPWSERKKYIWWDEQDGTWTGEDVPDFQPDKRPDYRPPDGAKAQARSPGTTRSSCSPTAGAGCSRPPGSWTARSRRTTSRTSRRSETRSTGRRPIPPGSASAGGGNERNPRGEFPYVVTTYRLTEHHTAGGMSRFLPYLAELQPAMFCEVSPELAEERGLRPRRLGDRPHRARIRRGAGRRHGADGCRDDRRPGRAPDRASVSLGQPRAHDGGRGQRPARSGPRPERAHPGVEGRDL